MSAALAFRPLVLSSCLALPMLATVGCGWVDATGVQPDGVTATGTPLGTAGDGATPDDTPPAEPVPPAPVIVDDAGGAGDGDGDGESGDGGGAGDGGSGGSGDGGDGGDGGTGNRAPEAIAPLPDVELVVGEGAAEAIDLSRWFFDPDDDALAFDVAAGSLPPSGALALSADGRLVGRPGPEDIGTWRVTLYVGDGRTTIARDFNLDVVTPAAANVAPTVTDIPNRTFEGSFRYDVAPFFDDADGDALRFTARGLPEGVAIDARGVIEGRVRGADRGRRLVTVSAEDDRGGQVEDSFRLTLE